MSLPRGVLLALPFLALLPGCPIWTGDGHRPGPGPECARDRDCPRGEICDIDGMCVPTGLCTDDRECATGEICSAGTCTPGSRTCRVDADCADRGMCDAGTCVPADPCSTDAECDDGFWCDFRGACVPRPDDACRTHADCTGGELCIEGFCRAREEACELDRDCPPGNVCLNNECTGICTDDSACASGDSCQGGFCRPNPAECTTSSTCGTGEHCVDGRCLPDCRAPGSTCEAGSYCEVEDDLCRPDWQPEPFCDEDSDCMTGRRCVDGVCRTPCPTMTDSQCLMIDAQLPLCRPEGGVYYCFAEREQTPECRVEADCTAGRDCLDGICRNRS